MKTDKDNPSGDQDISLKRAGEWLLDVNCSAMSPETLDEFNTWMSEDDTHRDKMDLVESVWNALDVLEDDPVTVKIVRESIEREQGGRRKKWFDRLHLNLPTFRYAAAAAAMVLVLGAFGLTRSGTPLPVDHRTGIGEQRMIYLTDGSTARLDTQTAISIWYDEHLRRVELREGQALFSVAHETDRAFVVTVGDVAVRALGTEFNVRKKESGKIAVAVASGRVQVGRKADILRVDSRQDTPAAIPGAVEEAQSAGNTADSQPAEPPRLAMEVVESGQQLLFDASEKTHEARAVEVHRVSAWQEGRLDFQETSLTEVVDELNRYLEIPMVIGDPDLGDMTISLFFKIKDRKDFLNTLEKVIPIASRTTADGRIIIYGKEMS
jgi:transmembrane sensor